MSDTSGRPWRWMDLANPTRFLALADSVVPWMGGAAAVLIATRYVLDYDYVVLLLGIAWLWRDGEAHGWGRWQKSLLALAWIAPLFARTLAEWTLIPLGLMTALAVLGIALVRASPSRHLHAASGR